MGIGNCYRLCLIALFFRYFIYATSVISLWKSLSYDKLAIVFLQKVTICCSWTHLCVNIQQQR